jgi:hypothetical protein
MLMSHLRLVISIYITRITDNFRTFLYTIISQQRLSSIIYITLNDYAFMLQSYLQELRFDDNNRLHSSGSVRNNRLMFGNFMSSGE